MDIQNYISSGILEQYVLGDLSAQQQLEIEANARQYPEIKVEINAIEDAFETIAHASAISPPLGLGIKILESIEDKFTPASADSNNSTTNQSALAEYNDKRTSNALKGFSFISVLLLLGALIWGYLQSNQNKENKESLNAMTIKYDQLASDCNKFKNNTNTHIAFLKDTNTQAIAMEGTDKSPESSATLFWNKEERKALLNIGNLPAVPTDKQYQLWAIVDGKPVDLGVFDLVKADSIFVEVPFIESPEAFAVTLEKVGGNPAPTMEEMYILGAKT